MRRWLAASIVLFAAIGLSTLHATGQDKKDKAGEDKKENKDLPKGEEESFFTADGVQLRGLFHVSLGKKGPSDSPVALLLYAPGPGRDMNEAGWAALAHALNMEGYNVFRFDWRGHGKSTDIKDPKKFWTNEYLNGNTSNFNIFIKGGGPKKQPLKGDFFVKDLGTSANKYMPAYLNDLAAVRLHLDTKNDNKTLNASSIFVIGANEAATLGMAWLAGEWKRPAIYPTDNQLGRMPRYEYVPQDIRGGDFAEAGADYSGAVWLSASRPTSISEFHLKQWVSDKAPKVRDNNPMLFLYGDKDATGKRQSEFFYNEVLVANGRRPVLPKLDQTFIRDVKGASTASGVKLLTATDANPKATDTIIQFLAAIQKERAKIPSKLRKYDTPYYFDVRHFNLKP